MPRTHWIGLSLVFVAASIVAPSSVAHAECGHFEACSSGHKLPPEQASNENPHYDCYACIEAPCHPVCGGGDFARAPHLKAVYVQILNSALRGDEFGVVRSANDLPGFVFYNASRDAVQIRACGSSAIVGSLPVTDVLTRLLASSLPSSDEVVAYASGQHQVTPTWSLWGRASLGNDDRLSGVTIAGP